MVEMLHFVHVACMPAHGEEVDEGRVTELTLCGLFGFLWGSKVTQLVLFELVLRATVFLAGGADHGEARRLELCYFLF
jgi:hypothetical protein